MRTTTGVTGRAGGARAEGSRAASPLRRAGRAVVVAGAVLAALAGDGMARPAAGQDNFSDITHPDPTEVVSSVVAAAVQLGEVTPQEPAFRTRVVAVVREARAGSVDEAAVRRRIGNVATSLLIRAGVLRFEGDGDGGEGGGPPDGHGGDGARSDMDAPEVGSEASGPARDVGAAERSREGPGDDPGGHGRSP